jgi:hypothetical protein
MRMSVDPQPDKRDRRLPAALTFLGIVVAFGVAGWFEGNSGYFVVAVAVVFALLVLRWGARGFFAGLAIGLLVAGACVAVVVRMIE